MTEFLNRIVTNGVRGEGPCSGCPAHADGRSQRVHPGLGDPDADLAFVTIEPSTEHTNLIDWSKYANWQEYNDAFISEAWGWDSGQAIERILAPLENYSFDDIWMCDSIKCSPDGSSDEVRPEEFACCAHYLEEEFSVVDPSVIVALGRLPTKRSLAVLDTELSSLSVRANAGRVLDTDPPLVVSTSWSHNHLDWSVPDEWGEGWIESHDHLDRHHTGKVIDVVRASVKYLVSH